MIFRITKSKNGKPPVLTCVRTDGSLTYQAGSEFFARHDLLHYAVETTLAYRHAFLGLIAGGRDIDSFGTRNGVRDTYTDEELWAEHIVGVLQWSLIGTDTLATNEELVARLAETCAPQGITPPPITLEQMQQIRARAHDLYIRWEAVEPGTFLELTF